MTPPKIAATTVLLFLLLPITIVLPVSLTDQRYLSLPQHGISLQHYTRLLTSEAWQSSIVQSALIATTSGAIAVVFGVLAAIGLWRLGTPVAKFLLALTLVPLVVPTIVYALGLYRTYAWLGLLDTYPGVVMAHAVTGMPYVVILTSTALAAIDPRLEPAARSLGATPAQLLRRVLLPLLRPAIFSGALLAFIHSWDELVLVLFIAGRRVFTLPRRMWDGINDKLDPSLAAVAVLLILLSAALLALDLHIRRRADSA